MPSDPAQAGRVARELLDGMNAQTGTVRTVLCCKEYCRLKGIVTEHSFPDMGPKDREQCVVTLAEHTRMYYPLPSQWTEVGYASGAASLFWKFGFLSWGGLAGFFLLMWWIHRRLRIRTINQALFEGYEMGFEAGGLTARGIPMEEYLKTVRSESEAW